MSERELQYIPAGDFSYLECIPPIARIISGITALGLHTVSLK